MAAGLTLARYGRLRMFRAIVEELKYEKTGTSDKERPNSS
jgi:hypothetical protein